jgi:hypothetical protein
MQADFTAVADELGSQFFDRHGNYILSKKCPPGSSFHNPSHKTARDST